MKKTKKIILNKLPLSQKILLTLFLISALVFHLLLVPYVGVKVGHSKKDWVEHYRGSETSMKFPRSKMAMMETLHFHSVVMPVFYGLICLIFSLTSPKETIKSTIIISVFVVIALEIGGPFLIRYVHPNWFYLKLSVSILMAVLLAILVFYPLYEIWFCRDDKNSYD